MGANRETLPPHLRALVEEVESKEPARPQPQPVAKPNKYGAIRTEYGGAVYDSKAEAARAAELTAMQKDGKIVSWQRQVTFRLGDGLDPYRVDFLVFDRYGHCHAEDVKGVETAKFRSHLRRWEKFGPCDLWVIKKKKTIVIGCAAKEKQP